LVGIFDVSPELIGQEVAGCTIRDAAQLKSFCLEHKPMIAAICTPSRVVPELVNTLAELGLKGFWNFSQCDISNFFSGDMVVETVQLSDSLMNLGFNLNSKLENT